MRSVKSQPVCVVASDTHLDWSAWERREGLVGDAFHSFTQIVDAAIAHRVPLALLGDVTNTKFPTSQTVRFLRSQMDKMQRAGLSVFYIQGQHERASPTWISAAHDWPQHLHQRAADLGPLRCFGLDWSQSVRLPELLAQVPENTDVLFLHQVAEEFMGSVCKCELSLSQVPHAKQVMIGDYHKHVVTDVLNADGRRMTVCSAGSTCMRAINEPPEKAFFLLRDDLSVVSLALKTRTVLQPPPLTTEEELNRFVEETGTQLSEATAKSRDSGLPEHLCKPLLWVHYTATLSNVWPRIVKAVGDGAFLFKRAHVPETPERAERRTARQKRAARGPAAALEELVSDRESFVYKAGLRLLSATDDEQLGLELQKLRAEYGLT